MKITHAEIVDAIASAAPPDGQKWEAAAIASAVAGMIESEAKQAVDDHAAWVEAREASRNAAFAVRIKPTGVTSDGGASIAEYDTAARAKNTELINAKITSDKAVIAGLGAAVVSAGTAFMTGGATTHQLVASLMGIGSTIADALNG